MSFLYFLCGLLQLKFQEGEIRSHNPRPVARPQAATNCGNRIWCTRGKIQEINKVDSKRSLPPTTRRSSSNSTQVKHKTVYAEGVWCVVFYVCWVSDIVKYTFRSDSCLFSDTTITINTNSTGWKDPDSRANVSECRGHGGRKTISSIRRIWPENNLWGNPS